MARTLPGRRSVYLSLFLSALLLAVLLLVASGCRQTTPQPKVDSLKILVADEGFYRLSLSALQEAGLAVDGLEANTLILSEAGQPVPFLVDDNALIFYGQAPTSRYTALRPYLLAVGPGGQTMQEASLPALPGPTLQHIRQTIIQEENYEYVSDAKVAAGTSPWFWQTLTPGTTVALSFELGPLTDGAGTVQIDAYGASRSPDVDPDHSLAVTVNGQPAGTIFWDGQVAHLGSISLPPGALQPGENEVVLQNVPEAHLDVMRLDRVALSYNAQPVARGDWLDFGDSAGRVSLAGFSQPPLLFDIADRAAPTLLTGGEVEADTVQLALSEEIHLAAVGPGGFRSPVAMTPLRESNWRATDQQADLIIVTTDELAPALEPLVTARAAQGLQAAVVPVAEIYDAFGYGAETPDSIRAFLRYAYEQWAEPRPRYLLLVGDATTDYRGYLAARPENPVAPPANIVPPYLVPVSFSGETVSDARLADLAGDERPELAVGRWPVDNIASVRQLVERTLAYEARATAGAPPRAIFAVDSSSEEFTALTQRLLENSHLPMGQAEVLPGPSAAALAEDWNRGAWLITYTGHGSLELWGQEMIFSADAVNRLHSPDSPPIVLQLTCLSGLFAHPETDSLAEVMIRDEDGPVLTVAATSLTISPFQEPFATVFLEALQDEEVSRIGDALQRAKQSLDVRDSGLREISDTFGLIGDPSALIARP